MEHLESASISIRQGRGMAAGNADIQRLKLSGDLSRAIAACMDDMANLRAMEAVERYLTNCSRHWCEAVYVIGAEDVPICKIGTALNPFKRLIELQVGNWHKLRIHGLVWFDRRARQIEKMTHYASREMGTYIRGEWLQVEPAEACELILKAARYDKQNAYDSATWLSNFGSRTEALAKLKKVELRIVA